jgi:hypothetical protein
VLVLRADPAKLSAAELAELERKIGECWVRHQKATREEMAPLLYQLRRELNRQGNHQHTGFKAWVKKNLKGLSYSTINRWADSHRDAIAQGGKKPAFTHLNKSRDEEPDAPDDAQYTITFTYTPEQRRLAEEVVRRIGPPKAGELFYACLMAQRAKLPATERPCKA